MIGKLIGITIGLFLLTLVIGNCIVSSQYDSHYDNTYCKELTWHDSVCKYICYDSYIWLIFHTYTVKEIDCVWEKKS